MPDHFVGKKSFLKPNQPQQYLTTLSLFFYPSNLHRPPLDFEFTVNAKSIRPKCHSIFDTDEVDYPNIINKSLKTIC